MQNFMAHLEFYDREKKNWAKLGNETGQNWAKLGNAAV
jgi:hypothetical protein